MLHKSQVIKIPLDSLVTQTKKFFIFKGEPDYDMDKINKIDTLINLTPELKEVVSTLFLLQHPETNFSTTEQGEMNDFDLLTTYKLHIENDTLIINISDELEVKANEIRDVKEYKHMLKISSSNLERNLENKVDSIINNTPTATKNKKVKTLMQSKSKPKYRNRDSYNRYRNDNDFWDYYFMYALFSDSDYNEYDNSDYEFYEVDDISDDISMSTTLLEQPEKLSPEEFYDADEDTVTKNVDVGMDTDSYENTESDNTDNNSNSNDSGNAVVGMVAGAAAGAAVYSMNEVIDGALEEQESEVTDAASSFAADLTDNGVEVETDSYEDTDYDDSSDNDDSDDS